MNIDKAINSEISSDIEELEKQIHDTWNRLVELLHNKQKLTLYQLVSTLPKLSNERPIHFHKESLSGGSAGSEDSSNR